MSSLISSVDELLHNLAVSLVAKGAIQSEEWQRAFLRVPRHVFVPRFYKRADDWGQEQWELVDGTRPEQREEWLSAVYEDQALITQHSGSDPQHPTSSSSEPSIMAFMLEALDVKPGHRVLEIGTGSGYNAALLCERLGAKAVTTIDIDDELVAAAQRSLESIGHQPTVKVADGAKGYPENAPYDRIIGTCFAWPVPQAWIEQTRPGGLVVVSTPGGVATLKVREDGTASGYLHPESIGFMYMRGYMPEWIPHSEFQRLVNQSGVSRPCRYPSHLVEAGNKLTFWSLMSLVVVPYQWSTSTDKGDPAIVDLSDRSWARVERDLDEAVQGGPRRVWDSIEELYEQWCKLGAPNRERFGLTIHPDGRHVLWLDDPDSEHCWEVCPTNGVASKQSAS